MSHRVVSSKRTGRQSSATRLSGDQAAPAAYELIALDLIDEPTVPERETMEEKDLADLAISIADVGLLNPLTVFRKGARFEVSAGHRRLLACRISRYTPVPCVIRNDTTLSVDAIKVHENAFRENVNAVEEARFYSRLLNDKCNNDVDQLCITVRRRREYVEDRLLILRWDPRIIESLHARRITMAVGRELAKVKDPRRLLILLDAAQTQGATARQVAQWRQQGDTLQPVGEAPEIDYNLDQQAHMIPAEPYMKCMFCDGTEDPWLMEMFFAHKPCKQILNRILHKQPAQAPEE